MRNLLSTNDRMSKWNGWTKEGKRTDGWLDNHTIEESQKRWEKETKIEHNLYQYLVCLLIWPCTLVPPAPLPLSNRHVQPSGSCRFNILIEITIGRNGSCMTGQGNGSNPVKHESGRDSRNK
jgi:hypothetical protein